MKPEILNIMGVPFKIIYCKNAIDVDPAKDIELLGNSSIKKQEIRIFEGNSPEFMWQTIIHEVLHMIGDMTKMNILNTTTSSAWEQNHKDLECLANILSDFLIRNELIKLLS